MFGDSYRVDYHYPLIKKNLLFREKIYIFE